MVKQGKNYNDDFFEQLIRPAKCREKFTQFLTKKGDLPFRRILMVEFHLQDGADDVRGFIQNIPDCCSHLYSSCGSAKHK
jgi:hypothetical protein